MTTPKKGIHMVGLRAAVVAVSLCAAGAAIAQDQPLNRLSGLQVKETDKATEIRVKGSAAPTFTVFKLSDPTRLFVDISNADASALPTPVSVGNGVISKVSTLQFNDATVAVGRIVVGLETDALYSVRARGRSLLIKIDASQRKSRRPVAVRGGGSSDAALKARVADAEARLRHAERRAKQAENRAKVAEEDATIARADAEQRAREAQSVAVEARSEAEVRAQAAEERARNAELAAAEARNAAEAREAEAAARGNVASRAAAEAKSAGNARQREAVARAAAERKATEAEVRAQAAEKRLSSALAQARREKKAVERKLSATERKLSAAERKANAAKRLASKAERKLSAAERKANDASLKASTAERKLSAAERKANDAKRKASTAERKLSAAERKVNEAEGKAADAERKAAKAERRARLAQKKVKALTKADARGKEAAEADARAREAEARAARAEARARRAEARASKLERSLASIESERKAAETRVAGLENRHQALSKQLSSARAAKDAARTSEIESEQRAKAAEIKAERARLAQLESKRASGKLDERVNVLQQRLAAAEKAEDADEAAELKGKLKRLSSEGAELRTKLSERDSELQKAKDEAERSREEARQLQSQLAAARRGRKSSAKAPTRITKVHFDHAPGGTHVRISFTGQVNYEVKREGERTRILEIDNALIDPSLERSLDTGEFDSAVKLVSSFQAPPPGDRVRVVVTLGQQVPDRVEVNGGTLRWTFDRPAPGRGVARNVPPAPTWAPPAPAGVGAATEVPYARRQAAVYTGPSQAAPPTGGDVQNGRRVIGKRKRYTGRKINIDIKDGDVHNVLRLLAKEGNVNIVTSDDVSGSVTLHLKLVPWDQALDIMLRVKGLDYVRDGDIIRVAPREELNKEREDRLRHAQVQEALKPLEVKLVTVNHAVASDLLPRVRGVLSPRGTANFDDRTNTVIVKDIVEHLEAAEDIVRRLDTQTPQVLIEARIVEVNTVNTQQLGIQWGGNALFSAATGNPTGLLFPSTVGISGGADDAQTPTEGTASNPNFIVNLPAAAGGGAGGALGLTFGSLDSTFNLNVRLSALQSRGTVKIVSSPKITTLDNKEATISQGVSIPISQVSAAGVQTVFFDAVLKLVVKPHVTQDGNIYLTLSAENNTPDFQNVGARGDPTILKKEAKTELLLRDGDTTVIGGIYTSNAGFSTSEVPYLAAIPILGALFRNHLESDRRTELLIFVTPRIVNRSAATVDTAQNR